MPDSRIQLVVFDLGGVLVRLARNWRHAFDHAQVPYNEQLDSEELSLALHQLVEVEEVGGYGQLGFFDEAGPLLGVEPNDLIRISDAYLQGPFPGAAELLHELHGHPVRTACLSNTNHNHWKDLANPGHPNGLPLHLLDHRFASQLVGHRKPNPGIYEHLENETRVTPGSILFFDDRADNIAAAHARAWNAHQVTDPDDPIAEVRDVLAGHGVLTD